MLGIHHMGIYQGIHSRVHPAYLRPSYRLHVTDLLVHGVEGTAWAQGRRFTLGRGLSPS